MTFEELPKLELPKSDTVTLCNEYTLRLIDAYIYKRREENPDYRPGLDFQRQHQQMFESLAVFCLKESISPELYVNACYDFNAVPNFPVNALNSVKFMTYVKSKELLRSVKEIIETDFKSSFMLFHRHYTELNKPVKTIIDDNDLYFTPLFRFVIACKFNVPELIAKYKDLALAQVYEQPLYYQVYSPLIPKDYQNEFEVIVPQYFGPADNS